MNINQIAKTAGAMLCISFFIHSSKSQNFQLQDDIWQPVGNSVLACKQVDSTLYIGGSFNYIGPPNPGFTSVDIPSGVFDINSVKPNGTIHCICPDGNGGWIIGGNFTRVSGQTRNNIARINQDGSLHPFQATPLNIVRTICRRDTNVYIGGDFTTVSGFFRNRFAALSLNTGNLLNWNPSFSGSVYSIVLSNNILYIGGNFTSVSSQTRNYLAALVPNGTLIGWNPNPNGRVNSIHASSSRIYIGGNFTSVGGISRNRIAAIEKDSAGSLVFWNPIANGEVRCIEIQDDKLYFGGDFTTVGGVNRLRLAAVDTVLGNLVLSWSTDVNATVRTIVSDGTSLFVGGNFTTVDGTARNNIARVNLSNGLLNSWNNSTSDTVYALAVDGSKLILAGAFRSAGGVVRNNLAAINVNTGIATNWDPNVNGEVWAIEVSDNLVYIGGTFTMIGVASRNKLGGIRRSTTIQNIFFSNAPNNTVTSLAFVNGTLYVGGLFTSAGSTTRNRLASYTINESTPSASLTTWNPNLNNGVYCMTVKNNELIVGGAFTTVGSSTSRPRLAAFNLVSGSLVSGWDPQINNGIVRCIQYAGSRIFIGGSFTSINSLPRQYIGALNLNGSEMSWNPVADGVVNAFGLIENNLIVGGDFLSIGGLFRNYIAAIDTTTGAAFSWNANANGNVRAISGLGRLMNVGGGFFEIQSETRNKLAVLKLPCINTPIVSNEVACGSFSRNGKTYISSGFYIDTIFNPLNCDSILHLNITILPLPPSTISHVANDTICFGDSLLLTTNSTNFFYQWKRNTNNIPGATSNFYFGYQSGNYQVQVTDTNNCSSLSNSISLYVLPRIFLTNSDKLDSICSGTPFSFAPTSNTTGSTFNWVASVSGTVTGLNIAGSGLISDTMVNTGTVPAIVSYTISPTGPAPYSCPGDDSVYTLVLNPIPNQFMPDIFDTICNKEFINHSNSSPVAGTSFYWSAQLISGNITGYSNGNGSIINQQIYNNDTVNGEFTYYITPTGPAPTFCVGPDQSFQILVKPSPFIHVSSNSPIVSDTIKSCSGLPITITGNVQGPGSYYYSWTEMSGPGTIMGAPPFNQNTIAFNPMMSGTSVIQLTVHDSLAGCSSIKLIHTNPNALASVQILIANDTICLSDTLILEFQGMNIINSDFRIQRISPFSPQNIFIGSGGSQAYIIPDSMGPGTYVVSVTGLDSFGCSGMSSGLVLVLSNPIPIISYASGFLSSNTLTGTFQWFLNDTLIPGPSTGFYQPTQNGNYHFIRTSPNGCKRSSAVLNIILTGFQDGDIESGFSIFPNPSEDFLSISGSQRYSYHIIDLHGKKLISGISNSSIENIEIKKLPATSYILEIQTDSKVFHYSFIKK